MIGKQSVFVVQTCQKKEKYNYKIYRPYHINTTKIIRKAYIIAIRFYKIAKSLIFAISMLEGVGG